MVDVHDIYGDPTLDAMYKTLEAEAAQEPPRTYLGASLIGEPCERKIWYACNGTKAAPISWQGLFAIEDGHRTEDLIAARLRKVPDIELWTHDENGNQFGFEDPFISGHLDGVIKGLYQAKHTPHIFEVKCCNEKKFDKLSQLKNKDEKSALQNWDEVYYAQAILYCGKFNLNKHYLICATPGGRKMESVRTDFNPNFYAILLEKARRIKLSIQPPNRITEYQGHFLCKFCRYSETCWNV